MGVRGQRRGLVCAWAILLAACGPEGSVREENRPSDSETVPTEETPPASTQQPTSPPDVVQPTPIQVGTQTPTPVAPLFQPGFNEALRWSYSASSVTTFRLRVPVSRAGKRVRLAFRSGDGAMTVNRVTVALAGANGALASTPVAVTFKGAAGFSSDKRVRTVSDPVPFTVNFRDELAISFEASGALAESAIETLPGSFSRAGSYATTTGALGGSAWATGIGLVTVDVEGPPARAFVALGDSITEGYMTGHDDTRIAWPGLTEAKLGVPLANAGVSGQGFYDESLNLDQEVLSLEGYTDCVILLGTNDLGSGLGVSGLETRMSALISRLQPRCRTWVSTLLPKEKTSAGDYNTVKAERAAFNAWIRQTYASTLIDLEAVTRQPGNPDLYISGYTVDGIHPSAKGHQVMAAEVVRVLRAAGVVPEDGVKLPTDTSDAPSPESTSSSP